MATLDPALVFSRPVPAPFRDANGSAAIAAAHVPRFDHDVAGAALGLLVEAGPGVGLADRVRLAAAVLGGNQPATVLHALTKPGGVAVQLVHYGLDASAMVDACLRSTGWHRAIGVVAGFLPIGRDGLVRYRRARWQPAAIVAAGAALLQDGRGRPLLAN